MYEATAYCADTPAGRLVARIGQTCPELDRLLEAHGATTWVFLTAHNPGSQPFPPEENERRHDRLEQEIIASGYLYYPGHSVGQLGDWPVEDSFLIMGATEAKAAEWAEEFG